MNQKKQNLIALFFFLLLTVPLAAQGFGIDKMDNLANTFLGIFTGPFVRTILILCLCGCAIAFGVNKDNEKMKRNCIAIGLALGILIAAEEIVKAIWTASGGKG